jgi:hypothetical protein
MNQRRHLAMVDKVIAKIVDVIRTTPAWEIDIKGYTVRPLEMDYTEIEILSKICDESPYLFVSVNDKTSHISFLRFNYVGPALTLHTVGDYPERSACLFAAALLSRALEFRYYRTLRYCLGAAGRRGVLSFVQSDLYPDLSAPSVETWVYSRGEHQKGPFCTLHFDVNVQPTDYEIFVHYHPNGPHNYTDMVSRKTNIREALNLTTQLISMYFL